MPIRENTPFACDTHHPIRPTGCQIVHLNRSNWVLDAEGSIGWRDPILATTLGTVSSPSKAELIAAFRIAMLIELFPARGAELLGGNPTNKAGTLADDSGDNVAD